GILFRVGRDTAELAKLGAELERRRQVPTIDARVIDTHTVSFALALMEIIGARSVNADADVMLWSQVAGVILPRVRADIAAALRQRHTASRRAASCGATPSGRSSPSR